MGNRFIVNIGGGEFNESHAETDRQQSSTEVLGTTGDQYLDIWEQIKDDVRMQILLSHLSHGVGKDPRTNLILRHIVEKYPTASDLDEYVSKAHGDLVFEPTYIAFKKLIYKD